MSQTWENFLEALAQLTSKALTDKETEAIIQGFTTFQEKLKRLSSENLKRLQLQALTPKDGKPHTLCQHEGKTCSQNVSRGFIKAFVVSWTIKYAIGAIPAVLTGEAIKRPRILRQMAGRDTLDFALFLSTFMSSYKAILCILRNLRNTTDRSSDKLNALIAGAVAGLSLSLDKNKQRRQAIMLYLVTRAGQFGCAWLMKRWAEYRRRKRRQEAIEIKEQLDMTGFQPGEKRKLVIPKKWDDKLAKFLSDASGPFVMMLASAQIIWSFLFESDTLPRAYYGFLLVHSGWKPEFKSMAAPLTTAIGATVRQLKTQGSNIGIPADVSSREFIANNVSPNIAQIIPKHLHHDKVMCALQHPTIEGCVNHKFMMAFNEFGRALKLYTPLNAVMTGVFRYNQIFTEPEMVLIRFLQSTLRSAIFLTAYVTFGMATPCLLRNTLNRERSWMYVMAGIVAGSTVVIESKGRQLELGLYCLPRSLESFWKCLVKWHYVRDVPNGDVILFSAAMGVLMTLYQNEPDTINKHYLNVMTRFFGRN